MGRTAIWTAIAEALRADIAEGRTRVGDKLATEAALSARFGVHRHTVRRAIRALAGEGLVHARRGSGVFVTAPVTEYSLGPDVSFSRNLAAAGRLPDRRIRVMETRKATAAEAEALNLAADAPVHSIEGVSLADQVPLALFDTVFPAERFPALLAAFETQSSVTAALGACGLGEFRRMLSRVTARVASATEALSLRIREGDALIQTTSVNVDPHGQPVEFGRTLFVGARVTLTLGAMS